MFGILRNGEISLNSPLFITLFYQKFLEIGSGDFFYRLNVPLVKTATMPLFLKAASVAGVCVLLPKFKARPQGHSLMKFGRNSLETENIFSR
jgi:hypothetical protein